MHPDGKEFYWKAGNRAVILVHGFTASTQEVYELGVELHKQGYTVITPLLYGHMDEDKFPDARARHMYLSVLKAYRKVKDYESVDVVGFSFGAMLGLRLALKHKIRKVVALSPAVRFKHRLMPFMYPISHVNKRYMKKLEKNPHADIESIYDIWDKNAIKERSEGNFAYDFTYPRPVNSMKVFIRKMMKELKDIKNPLLIMHSTKDRTVSFKGAEKLYDRIGSEDKRFIPLHSCGHVITVDKEKETVFRDVIDFLR